MHRIPCIAAIEIIWQKGLDGLYYFECALEVLTSYDISSVYCV